MTNYPMKPGAATRIVRVLVSCLIGFFALQLISIYLSWPKQVILGGVSILLGLAANRVSTSRVVTLGLMLISMTATFRYGWWRVQMLVDFFSDESNQRVSIDSFFLLLLVAAEAYTVLIMLLGYMQTAWPLERKPLPMPGDESLWPHVDVLIPTYNEPLSLVRYTALAAINIDYPPDKLHVYILDDGTREDFMDFSRAAGIGYVTRAKHNHAKAGNINHALSTMDSPYVTIFDCDHVPTRSFLQMTLGWMLADKRLAMLQTPHHFYSPDPFERNLLQYKTIPNEAELFYGIVQDGNDFWNATFFCGSCALIRRSALDEVGGIATETVTEDAHTSLRMQKRGYNTAYINIPQAAGLATETLAAHVGQRIRWARGMIQILRIDNPLFGGGMKFTQRLCYFNAMIHFFYALPRLIFLGAPLVYLLLGRTIIPGYWVAILAYALPHLVLASLTNSHIQGRHRHSFWNEIYEAVLAPYILAPTLLALINPKLGKFNVTDKGNTLSETQFDSKIAAPTKWMLLLNAIGILAVPYRLLVTDPQHPGAVIMNLVWVLFNIVILGVAAAVAHEQKQRRESVRVNARIRLRIDLPNGRELKGMSIDMSVGGASIQIAGDTQFQMGNRLRVAFPEIAGDAEIAARVVGVHKGVIRVAFHLPTIIEQETLTRVLYSRADAWLTSIESKEVDRPLVSLGRVIVLSGQGLNQICKSMLPKKGENRKTSPASTVAVILFTLLLGNCGRASGMGAQREPLAEGPAAVKSSAAQAFDAPPLSDNIGRAAQVLSLRDMGQTNPIELSAPHSFYSVHFTLPHGLVPRQGTLKLIYRIDGGLDPHSTSLRISLNGTGIASLPSPMAQNAKNGFVETSLPLPDSLLVRSNTIGFEFSAGGVIKPEDQSQARILCRIFPASALEVSGDRLRLDNDLSQLPLPFFDSDLQTTTTIPFVFLAQPTPKMLEAAGIVASWLGLIAGAKPPRFVVSMGQIPPGNAILFANDRSPLSTTLHIPSGGGPLLALKENPIDPYGSLLLLAGDDDDQLVTAARRLSLKPLPGAAASTPELALTGDAMDIPPLALPPDRGKDDAPRWLSVGKADPLASCQAQNKLQTDGSTPIPVYFHVPPDLFYGEKQNVNLHLHYRYDARQVAAGSALRIYVNGRLVNEAPLPPGFDFADRQRFIAVPVTDIRPFGNTILFNFDFVPSNRDATQNAVLSGEILCNTTLDLSGLSSWTRLPNLELFANAGYPFTQLADLSKTVVVLPDAPSGEQIALYLQLMSHFGAQTGYPALRVTVDTPGAAIRQGRDYLIFGTISNRLALNSLDPLLPVTLDAQGVHVKPRRDSLDSLTPLEAASARWWAALVGQDVTERLPSNIGGIPDALVEEIESPVSPGRSIVAISLRQNESADTFASVFLDRSQSQDLTGSVSLLRNTTFESYLLSGDTYRVGDISWYATMRIYFTRYFLLLLLLVTDLSFVLAYYMYDWMRWHARDRLKLAETASKQG
jgi:cellulose synthase (UDP-forming)